MVKKFWKKPVLVDALQWTGDNETEIYEFTEGRSFVRNDKEGRPMVVQTSEGKGRISVDQGDWILKGKGEFDTCKPDIFVEEYSEWLLYEKVMEWKSY